MTWGSIVKTQMKNLKQSSIRVVSKKGNNIFHSKLLVLIRNLPASVAQAIKNAIGVNNKKNWLHNPKNEEQPITYPEEDWSGEVLGLGDTGLDIRALNNVWLSFDGSAELESKACSGVRHGQSGRATACLCLHHLRACLLQSKPVQCQLQTYVMYLNKYTLTQIIKNGKTMSNKPKLDSFIR